MNKIWPTIVYSAKFNVWVLLFLALIQPFGIDNLEEDRLPFILTETLLSFISVTLSCMIVNSIFGKQYDDSPSAWAFIKRVLLGNAINIPLLGTFLLTYNSWFNTGNISEYWFHEGQFTIRPLLIMCMYVGCISVFIVIVQYFSFRNIKLQRELDEVKAINMMLEKRQERLIQEEEAITNDDVMAKETGKSQEITIVGQGQGATLTLCPTSIIYVESMANYADICYISDNETRHKTLRITLKQIRETLEEVECIVQCHRAFLVNLNFVVSMTSTKSSYSLQLFSMDKQIPVSRANTDAIKAKLV